MATKKTDAPEEKAGEQQEEEIVFPGDKPKEKSEEKSEEKSDEKSEKSEEIEETQTKEEPKAPQVSAEDAAKFKKLYNDSSREAVRLKEALDDNNMTLDAAKKIINSNPTLKAEFAKTLEGGDYNVDILNDDGTLNKGVFVEAMREVIREEMPKTLNQNPALQSITDEKENASKTVYLEFSKNHPEINTDPEIQRKFEIQFRAENDLEEAEGRPRGVTKPLLERTWQKVTGEAGADKELEGMEKMANKQDASQSSTTSEGTKTSKGLSPEQRKIAQAFGLSEEKYLEGVEMSEKAKE